MKQSNCPTGKIKHRTSAAALAWHDQHHPVTCRRAYRCSSCGRWHITTTPLAALALNRGAIR